MRIEVFRIETTNLLRGLVNYHKKMESQLCSIKDEEEEKLRSLELDDTEEMWALESQREAFCWTYDFFFPRSLRYSFVVLLFLTLENQLYGLCDEIRKRHNLPIRAKDLSGDAIARCKLYLQNLAGINKVDEQLWVEIADFSKVRNCIVHTLGKVELSSDQKRLRDLAFKAKGLSISNETSPEKGILIIEADYCSQSLQHVTRFFDELFDAAGFEPAIFIY